MSRFIEYRDESSRQVVLMDCMARPGRPRSEQSRCSILRTALHLARTLGYAQLTVDGIAAKAGVGKQTIYRWWPSKAAVVLEALRENARIEIEIPDTGSLRGDLEGFLRNSIDSPRRRPGIDRVLRAVMAEAQHDPDLAKALKRDFIDARREALRGLFVRAHERGEIRSLAAVELWIDIAFGVFWYRLLADVGPLNGALAAGLASVLARAAAAPVA
jgi:AcrR family transcriptional regulator